MQTSNSRRAAVCLTSLLITALLGTVMGELPVCNSTDGIPLCDISNYPLCNCCYEKSYSESVILPCFDTSNDCSWSHKLNNSLMPINEELLTNNSAITLQGNFATESYGTFTADSFNESCSYLVIPLFSEANCDNCTRIMINGTERSNNEVVYANTGDDIIIEGHIPAIYTTEPSSILVFNNTNTTPPNCHLQNDNLRFKCSNLTSKETGIYRIHFSFSLSLNSILQWSSNNVMIIVQCSPWAYGINVIDKCISDFTVEWKSADYDPYCEIMSYYVSLTEISTNTSLSDGLDQNNTMQSYVVEKHINFTGLSTNKSYYVEIQAVSMEGNGKAVTLIVHTLNATSAQPNKPENVTAVESVTYISVSWSPVESPYCGDVLYYVCSLIHQNTTIKITTNRYFCKFNELNASTTYYISIAAVNRAVIGEAAFIYAITDSDDSSEDHGEVTTETKISTIAAFVFIVCISVAIIIFANKRRKSKKYKVKIVRVVKL